MALCEMEVRRFPSFQWQLEPSSDYPLYGEILVKLFPAQGGAIQSEAHPGQIRRACGFLDLKEISGKAYRSSIGQFEKNCPVLGPGTGGAKARRACRLSQVGIL